MKGSTFTTRVDRLPYTLSAREKDDMRRVFRAVMKPLRFSAKESFLDRLFETDVLVRVFTEGQTLGAFGNIVRRTYAGRPAWHILTAYVDPAYQGQGLLVRAMGAAIVRLAAQNALCVLRPMYVTGSSVNPMTMLSLARRTEVWPDLLHDRQAPAHIRAMADEAAEKFYPARGDQPFQVRITEDFVELADAAADKSVQVADDPEYNRKFFRIASIEHLTLVFFVAEVRFEHVVRHLLQMMGQRLKRSRQSPRSASALA